MMSTFIVVLTIALIVLLAGLIVKRKFFPAFDEEGKKPATLKTAYTAGVEELDLSSRIERSLKAEGYFTVGAVDDALMDKRLSEVPGIGKVSVSEIDNALGNWFSG